MTNLRCDNHQDRMVQFCISEKCTQSAWGCIQCFYECHSECKVPTPIKQIFNQIENFLDQIRESPLEMTLNHLAQLKQPNRTLKLESQQQKEAEMCIPYIRELLEICKCCQQVARATLISEKLIKSKNASKILKLILQNEMATTVQFDFPDFVYEISKLHTPHGQFTEFIKKCQVRNKSGMLGKALNILLQCSLNDDPQELNKYKNINTALSVAECIFKSDSFTSYQGENNQQNEPQGYVAIKQQNQYVQKIQQTEQPTQNVQEPRQYVALRQNNQKDFCAREPEVSIQVESQHQQQLQPQYNSSIFQQVTEKEITIDRFSMLTQNLQTNFDNKRIIHKNSKPIMDFQILDDKLISFLQGKTIQIINYGSQNAFSYKSFPCDSDMKHQFIFQQFLFNLSRTEMFIINLDDWSIQKIDLSQIENVFAGSRTSPVVCSLDKTSFLLYLVSLQKIYLLKLSLKLSKFEMEIKKVAEYLHIRCSLASQVTKNGEKHAIFGDIEGQLLDCDQAGNLSLWKSVPKGEEIRSLLYFKDEMIISLSHDEILFWKGKEVILSPKIVKGILDYLCFMSSPTFAVFYDNKIEVWDEQGKQKEIQTNLNTNRARKYENHIFVLTEGKQPSIIRI